jgi:hypothetical protein
MFEGLERTLIENYAGEGRLNAAAVSGLNFVLKSIAYDLTSAWDGDYPVELLDYDPREIDRVAVGNWDKERSPVEIWDLNKDLTTKRAFEHRLENFERAGKNLLQAAEYCREKIAELDQKEAPTDQPPESQ